MVDRRHLLALGVGTGAAVLLAGSAKAAPAAAVGVGTLEGELAAGRAEFRATRYADLARRLSALQSGALAAREGLSGSARSSASIVLARVHILTSELDVKRGDSEAAWSHACAAVSAAEDSGDPTVLAEATRICATPLRRQGRSDDAVLLLEDTIGQLGAESRRAEPGIVAASGSLALTAAYSAALAGRETTALSLVDMAKDAVGQLTAASRPRSGNFASHQVQLYLVGVHHLLGQDAAAVRIARRIDPRALPTDERRARLGTDTTRALLALGQYDQAFTELLAIESVAPEEVHRPSLRALTGEVLAHRPALPGLRDFAARTRAVPA